MARIRTIKPQFWLDETLGTIPREARLLYVGLWNLCDDRGVFEFRPDKIRVQLFPYDKDVSKGTVEKWLTALVDIKNVVTFQENGEPFGYIPTFLKHQEIKKPSKWAFTTSLPDVTSNPPVTHQLPTSSLKEKEKEKEKEKLEGKDIKTPYGSQNNVFLTLNEYKKLQERFKDECQKRIDNLSLYLASKGKQYKSHYATILSWAMRDEIGGSNNGNGEKPTVNKGNTSIPGNRPAGAFADIV
jgi:hypothetical protein